MNLLEWQRMENRPDRSSVFRSNDSNSPGGLAKPFLRTDERKSRAFLALAFAAFLVGIALVPLAAVPSFLSLHTCAFKGATGLPCPLCGGTRAAQALLRGDLVRACYLNVAALPAIAALVGVWIVLIVEATRGRAVINWNAVIGRLRSVLPLLVALLFLYWILHLADAVRASKLELVDVRHPVARAICKHFSSIPR